MNKFVATTQLVEEITDLKESYMLLEDLWVEMQRDTRVLLWLPRNLYCRLVCLFGDPNAM